MSLTEQLSQNQNKIFPGKVIVYIFIPERFVLPSVYKHFLQTKTQKVSIQAKSHFKSDLKLSAFLEMLTKSVTIRATTATRSGCVQHGLNQKKPVSGRRSRNAAEDDPRPNILQLNNEGFTDNKIFVIEQLVYENKSFFVVQQETLYITADKLVIPNFSLAGSILSRNHGLATFVY